MFTRFRAALAASLLLVSAPAFSDYQVKDGTGTLQTMGSFGLNGIQFPKHVMVDPTTGAAIGVASNPMVVSVTNLPAAGQKTMANSLPTVPASDYVPPLATNAATAAAQATGNTSAASIDAKTPPLTSAALTQTCTALPAGASTTFLQVNTARRSLRWQNVGTAPMTVAPGTGTVTVGTGLNYEPPGTAGGQGGGTSFDGAPTPAGAFSAISTAGTTVCAWEGN